VFAALRCCQRGADHPGRGAVVRVPSIVVTQAIGIGLAVALDATVIRVLLVPAAMRLLGRRSRSPGAGTASRMLA
jgi:uncharacterized membrane protein YdfJ with MMPL/SSD domain